MRLAFNDQMSSRETLSLIVCRRKSLEAANGWRGILSAAQRPWRGFFPFATVRASCTMSCCKQNFVRPRGNSDIEVLQKVNAQDGACYGALQKGMFERVSFKLDNFWNDPQVGIGLPFSPLRIGSDGLSFELCETMLKVAPASPRNCFFEITSFKKSKPAFVGNDIAVAAWTLSAVLGRPGGLISFQTVCKGEYTCLPLHHNNCGTCTNCWAGSWSFGNSTGWHCYFLSGCPFCRGAYLVKMRGFYCTFLRRRRRFGLGRRRKTTHNWHVWPWSRSLCVQRHLLVRWLRGADGGGT